MLKNLLALGTVTYEQLHDLTYLWHVVNGY